MGELGLMHLGAGLCALSVIMLMALMAAVILDGEQRAWGAPAEPRSAPPRRRPDAAGVSRPGLFPRLIGATFLALIFAGFCATALWLATLGLTAIGLGSAVDAAVVALKK